MNVLIATGIYPPESGGPSQYARGFALALKQREIPVSVLSYGTANSDQMEDGFRVSRVSRSGGPVIRYIRFFLQAYRMAKRHDVLFLQGSVSEGFPATIAAWLAGTPTVLRLPGDYAWEMAQQAGETDLLDVFLQKRHGGKIGWYERMERHSAKRAKQVIAPSRYLKTVAEKWGVPADHVQVILNAEHSLPEHLSREEARKKFYVEGKVVCLTVVRAVPWKGVSELIAWWKELPESHVLVVGGDGPEYETWKKQAAPLGERVLFVGRLNRQELADWYRASDVFMLHSGYEGYPHVVAEAASIGVPCLVSDQGGNPETKDVFGDTITVLPFRNKEAWVNALKQQGIRQLTILRPSRWTHEQLVDAVLEVLTVCAS